MTDTHDFLYANQDSLGPATYLQGAKTLGLNTTAFQDCLISQDAANQVDNDLSEGALMNVLGTPSFLLSGFGKTVRLNGAYPFPDFKTAIDGLINGK